jgi:dCMP deaminase
MNQRMVDYYLRLAKETASLSRAVKLRVGAIIVTADDAIVYGWNGMPAKSKTYLWDNVCEYEIADGSLKTFDEVLHAEANALSKLAKSTLSGRSASIFCTHSPCINCAKMIYQAGITSMYYLEDYRCDSGVVFLQRCGVNISKVDI